MHFHHVHFRVLLLPSLSPKPFNQGPARRICARVVPIDCPVQRLAEHHALCARIVLAKSVGVRKYSRNPPWLSKFRCWHLEPNTPTAAVSPPWATLVHQASSTVGGTAFRSSRRKAFRDVTCAPCLSVLWLLPPPCPFTAAVNIYDLGTRHGESQWTLENRFTGWYNIQLSHKGEIEAAEGGKLIRDAGYTFGEGWSRSQ